MGAHLVLAAISETEINALVASGAKLDKSIQHADKYKDADYALLKGRLDGAQRNEHKNRKGLPSHMYIHLPSDFMPQGEYNLTYLALLERIVVPSTIVLHRQDLKGWAALTALERATRIQEKSKNALFTIEVYLFRPSKGVPAKLVDGNGKANDALEKYMEGLKLKLELVNELVNNGSVANASGAKPAAAAYK